MSSASPSGSSAASGCLHLGQCIETGTSRSSHPDVPAATKCRLAWPYPTVADAVTNAAHHCCHRRGDGAEAACYFHLKWTKTRPKLSESFSTLW